MRLILASSSETRKHMLTAAGVSFESHPARIDEDSLMSALQAEGTSARDIADTLAEMKARKIADRFPEDIVIGSDQVLAFNKSTWGKPSSKNEANQHLRLLRGHTHSLFSAVVIYHRTQPVWRIVKEAKMTMRQFSDQWLEDYLTRNWESVQHSAGAYKIEEEGVRLFSVIEGDHFAILGLPLLPVLDYLAQRGWIPS